jgi:DNA integrity scanning protein DisA with diadenylate cyclase activity
VIIDDNQIKAARCVLPVSERDDFPAQLGMRHRAASGITESTDAVAIIVSEQTGDITYSINGELEQNLKPEELRERLEKVFRQA